MARELHTCLVRYFARLEKLDEKWKELTKKADRPLQALANKAEQLRLVSKSVKQYEDSMGGESRERLLFKILMSCEDELAFILDIVTQLNDANQDLKNYLINLTNARSKVSLKDETMKELVNGTAYQPKLDLLLQWAVESFELYHNIYLRIKDRLKLIDFKAEETVYNLISSFAIEKRERRNLNRILTFTEFLIKETPR